ncbi:MAG: YdcF family protein [Bacteroidales bacterium]|nr:YdcF family protein [Bacteroidales bacterium]
MFFILSKVTKFLFMPLSWVTGLLVATFFVRKHESWRRWLFIAAIAILLVFSNKPLLQLAQYHRTRKFTQALPAKRHYPMAIVLGGYGCKMNVANGQFVPFRDRSSRLFETIRLHQMGIVDKMLVTGDESIALDAKGSSTADAFLRHMRQMGIPDSCWILEQHARNTRENATLSIAILDSLGISPDSCLLVTSASHMNRSLACFAAEGWSIDPFATQVYTRPEALSWRHFLPSWQTLADWEELFNEYFGELAYKVVGYN